MSFRVKIKRGGRKIRVSSVKRCLFYLFDDFPYLDHNQIFYAYSTYTKQYFHRFLWWLLKGKLSCRVKIEMDSRKICVSSVSVIRSTCLTIFLLFNTINFPTYIVNLLNNIFKHICFFYYVIRSNLVHVFCLSEIARVFFWWMMKMYFFFITWLFFIRYFKSVNVPEVLSSWQAVFEKKIFLMFIITLKKKSRK